MEIRMEQNDEADLLVSAIPPTAQFEWAELRLAPGAAAYDLAYRSTTTPFLSWAAAAGARTANGLGMLVYQAAASLALWTGRQVPVEVMFAAARRVLKEDL
jgi:shikimate 5-dehydrogenase